MRISSSERGLGCQSVYRVLRVLDGDINFHLDDSDIEREEFEFDTVLVGSAALAVHADRKNLSYQTDTKDVDLYTGPQMAELELFEQLTHTKSSAGDRSQFCYDTTSAPTSTDSPGAFVDVITDYNRAFNLEQEKADEMEHLLEEDASGDPIMDGTITVYLPSLETLDKTFDHPPVDYTERRELIDRMR